MGRWPKWLEEYPSKVEAMSNMELFDEYTGSAQDQGSDQCTNIDDKQFEILSGEIKKRLSNWLAT